MENKNFLIVTVLLITTLISGCTSDNPIALRRKNNDEKVTYYDFKPSLYVGDHLKYGLLDGEKGELIVTKIKPETLEGNKGEIIPLSKLAYLEREDISTGKTAALVGGGVVGTAALVFLAGVAVIGIGVATSVS
ncbi:hypothetical protein [Klebsiella aerogenes]|uniref:hypothetical protein n=1 Tax=Klebsiella aerogenes TaxID=548 RepID=UPI0036B669F8